MKNLSPIMRLVVWAIIGIALGAVISLLLISGLAGESGDDICFYIGIAVLIVGLFASMQGTPGSTGGADKEGNNVYYNSTTAMDEEASGKAMEEHYHDNHVVDANAFGFCLIPAGIIMAVIAHLSVIGAI